MYHVFLLLLLLTTTHAQSPPSISLPLNDAIAQPISIPPSARGAFQRVVIPLSVTPNTVLIAELRLESTQPHSGPHAPLLSASTESAPSNPDTSSPCSQQQPCPTQPFDDIAFYTRADTATITLPLDAPTAFVVVYNWKLPSLPARELKGTLHLLTLESLGDSDTCPGRARGNVCSGRGSCAEGECRCEQGWGGRACGTRLAEAPGVSELPTWEGAVRPMRESAVVTIPAEGVTYVWKVSGEGRWEFRARLLRGEFVEDGRKEVDGGGGLFRMVVKQAFDNLGEGLDKGTRLPSLYDAGGVARVVASSGGVYEVVTVGEGAGNWLMGLVVEGGTAVVSVNVRRCGADGVLDCAFGEGGGGFPVGVVVGVSVVGVVLLAVVVVLACCWSKRRGRKERKSASGAWTDVDLSRIEAMHQAGEDSVR